MKVKVCGLNNQSDIELLNKYNGDYKRIIKEYIGVVNKPKEVENKSVTIRKLGSEKQETLPLDQAIKNISQKNKFPIN